MTKAEIVESAIRHARKGHWLAEIEMVYFFVASLSRTSRTSPAAIEPSPVGRVRQWLGQRNVLRADLHAVLSTAAVSDATDAHYGVQTLSPCRTRLWGWRCAARLARWRPGQ